MKVRLPSASRRASTQGNHGGVASYSSKLSDTIVNRANLEPGAAGAESQESQVPSQVHKCKNNSGSISMGPRASHA